MQARRGADDDLEWNKGGKNTKKKLCLTGALHAVDGIPKNIIGVSVFRSMGRGS